MVPYRSEIIRVPWLMPCLGEAPRAISIDWPRETLWLIGAEQGGLRDAGTSLVHEGMFLVVGCWRRVS